MVIQGVLASRIIGFVVLGSTLFVFLYYEFNPMPISGDIESYVNMRISQDELAIMKEFIINNKLEYHGAGMI